MKIDLCKIPGALYPPRPNWEVIRKWVEEGVDEADRAEAWGQIVDQWLAILNEALGEHYQTLKDPHLAVFAPSNDVRVDSLLRSAAAGLSRIVRALGTLAVDQWEGPLVILLFESAEVYDLYISAFSPGGDPVNSSGMCIRTGYLHIALRPSVEDEIQRSLLHELTHACLSHLSLPLWLEEGISQMGEEEAHPAWARFTIDAKTAGELRSFWRLRGLSDFWWGKGFHAAGEPQTCSYLLAQVLFRIIASDHRDHLPDLVRHAHADDAGDAAARQFLGMGIAELASQFLGPGEWEPVPPDSDTYNRRACLRLTRREFSQAIADFTEVLKLDPLFPDARLNRGFAYQQSGAYAAAIEDYDQVLLSDPQDSTAHNNLAWLLATCPDDRFRNGQRALKHGRKACELTFFSTWYCLGTLAAACAELGDFESARKWGSESMERAPEDEIAGCEERLQMYWRNARCTDHFPLQQSVNSGPVSPIICPRSETFSSSGQDPGEITKEFLASLQSPWRNAFSRRDH